MKKSLKKKITPKGKNVKTKFLISDEKVENLAKILTKQAEKELWEKKYAGTKEILKLVGAGFFLAASLVAPNLPRLLKKSFKEKNEASKRFNIPYLKRSLRKLEEQKLIEIFEEGKMEVVKLTKKGKIKILKYALDELKIEKPKNWDGTWRLISYDIPHYLEVQRKTFRSYLKSWEFYPFHESLFLHAYPCEKEIEFLREYLGIGKYVRIFTVLKIEDDKIFREFFGV